MDRRHILDEQTALANKTRGGGCKFLQLRFKAQMSQQQQQQSTTPTSTLGAGNTLKKTAISSSGTGAQFGKESKRNVNRDSYHQDSDRVSPMKKTSLGHNKAVTRHHQDAHSNVTSSNDSSSSFSLRYSSQFVPVEKTHRAHHQGSHRHNYGEQEEENQYPPSSSSSSSRLHQQHQGHHHQSSPPVMKRQDTQVYKKEVSAAPNGKKQPSPMSANDIDAMPLPMPGHREPDFTKANEMVVTTEGGSVQLVAGNAPSPSAQEALSPCSICGRKFAQSRLEKHMAACEKASQARKKYDTKQQRLQNLQGVSESELQTAASYGKQLEEKLSQKKTKNSWRQQRAQLLAGIKPQDPNDSVEEPVDSRVQCAGCGRKFEQTVWERHEPKCVAKAQRGGR